MRSTIKIVIASLFLANVLMSIFTVSNYTLAKNQIRQNIDQTRETLSLAQNYGYQGEEVILIEELKVRSEKTYFISDLERINSQFNSLNNQLEENLYQLKREELLIRITSTNDLVINPQAEEVGSYNDTVEIKNRAEEVVSNESELEVISQTINDLSQVSEELQTDLEEHKRYISIKRVKDALETISDLQAFFQENKKYVEGEFTVSLVGTKQEAELLVSMAENKEVGSLDISQKYEEKILPVVDRALVQKNLVEEQKRIELEKKIAEQKRLEEERRKIAEQKRRELEERKKREEKAYLESIRVAAPPSPIKGENKLIYINLSTQMLYAYQQDIPILASPVTTGKDITPTPSGTFAIYSKQTNTSLKGYDTNGDWYDLPVKYWMPFYQANGIHDAYWRSVYGTGDYHDRGSLGCVNTPLNVVAWIYNWAPIGTTVHVN